MPRAAKNKSTIPPPAIAPHLTGAGKALSRDVDDRDLVGCDRCLVDREFCDRSGFLGDGLVPIFGDEDFSWGVGGAEGDAWLVPSAEGGFSDEVATDD